MPLRPRAVAVAAGLLALLTPLALPAGTASANVPTRPQPGRTVDLQILSINDFHGHLESTTPGCLPIPGSTAVDPACRNRPGQQPTGGAEYLSTHLSQLRQENPRNTVTVTAGDNVGASPLISALFHDEPAIDALDAMGIQGATPGNHEFDEGLDELMRLQRGGCHPTDGCFAQPDGGRFRGAAFPYLASNIVKKGTNQLVFPPFAIRLMGGVPVAFIGADLKDTPSIVTPSGVAKVDFLDESDSINRYSRALSFFGIKTQVVMIHDGSVQADPTGGIDECKGGLAAGPFVTEVGQMAADVDVVLSGHSHAPYNCRIADKLVVSASSFGRAVADVKLTVDRRTLQVTASSAKIVPVTQDVPKDPKLTKIVDFFRTASAPLANKVVGSVTADLTTTQSPAGESQMGDVVADSQLEATQAEGAVAAFMNPGGVRAPITFANSTGGEAPGQVTYGEIFTVQPFGNNLTTLDLTGAQIKTMLEQQWLGGNATAPKILLPSTGFTYSWSTSAPAGSKVDASTIKINGVVVDPAATYRITVNSFLADGGDGFTVIPSGANRVGGAVDLDAMQGYLAAHSPVAPPALDRITVTP